MAIINGDGSSNNLFGTNSNDQLFGFGGFDLLFGSLGNDTLDGGSDTDVALYDGGLFTNGVFINNTDTAIGTVLAYSVDKRGFGTDSLIDVSSFHGSQTDDTIYVGGSGDSYTFDRGGDDLVVASQDPNASDSHYFVAGSGNDTYAGTVNNDRVTYEDADGSDAAGPIFQGVTVDLAAGTAIDGWGNSDSLTSIEQVDGTRFNDEIRGNDDRNEINGLEGNDTLEGRGGNDGIRGGAGNDTIDGGSGGDYLEGDIFEHFGSDRISGGEGDDWIAPGWGNDTIDGGTGRDNVVYDYWGFSNGVYINNTATSQDGVAAFTTDTRGFGLHQLAGIERFQGSEGDDVIRMGDLGGIGGHSVDRGGDDLVVADQSAGADDHYFEAGSGNDTLIGTIERDWVDYRDYGFDNNGGITQGVVVDLAAGTATDGWGDSDVLTSIERIAGTRFTDVIRGNDGRNEFNGLEGADTLDGRGGDRDRARYRDDPAAVFVNLDEDFAIDGWGDRDTLLNIEEARGSEFNDTLLGDAGRNNLQGVGGDDSMRGFGGNDFFQGDDGNDTIDGGAGEYDSVSYYDDPTGAFVDLGAGTATDGWGGTDVLIDVEEIEGSGFNDTLIGDGNYNFIEGRPGDDLIRTLGDNDNLRGSQGNDTLDGGDGDDRAEYHRDADRGGPAAVSVDLAAGTATDGFGDTDTLISIERVRGTDSADLLLGDEKDNELEGEGGNDTIEGRGGDDDLRGGAGDDSLVGGDGRDQLRPGEGDDYVDGGESFAEFNGGDRVRYDHEHEEGGFQGINVDLAAGLATDTWGNTDVLISIEEVEGSIYDDTILGSDTGERLRGEDGNDFIDAVGGLNNDLSGEDGNDTLLGSDTGGDFLQPGRGTDFIDGRKQSENLGRDELSYFYDSRNVGATLGITLNMTAEGEGTVLDYGGATDTFLGIEQFRGTNNGDLFNGTDGDQEFKGMGGDDTINGGAGWDRLYYRSGDNDPLQIQGIVVDMVAGTATDRYGDTDTFTSIEEIDGSRFADTIIGNNDQNDLEGREGDDLIDSFGGEDNYLGGGRGNDTLEARGNGDFARGGDGNDLITFYGEGGGVNPGLGSDTIIGGTEGFFAINYDGVGTDLIIDTATGTTRFVGSSDVDSFTNIRNTEGGDGNDTLLGDDSEEFQRVRSSRGDDYIDGRGGFDMIEYDVRGETGVAVDFSDGGTLGTLAYTGTVTGAFTGTDYFINIEEARGSDGNDTFTGNGEDNRFRGMDGNDAFDGGAGFDSVSYSSDRFSGGGAGVMVDLTTGLAKDGWGKDDTLVDIERIVATDLDDTLIGSAGDDRLIGIEGNDLLTGGAGNDGLYAGGGADTVTGGEGQDSFGGRPWELDGDTFNDFDANDRLQVFDDDFNRIEADVTIVGNEMRIDTNGDGVAEATVLLTNGFTGPVTVDTGTPSPDPTIFSFENAGLFTAALAEDAGSASVTLTRTGDTDAAATIDVTLTGSGLTPAEASDVTTTFGTPVTVAFAPGEAEASFSVDIVDDALFEPFEDLALTLSNPTSAGAGEVEIDGAQTFLRILDNDLPPSVRIDGEKRNEDAGEITFTVSRTGDLAEALTVPYAITSAGGLQGAEADDLVGGLPQSGSVTIAAGDASASFDVVVAPDTLAELHDDIIATISAGEDWPDGLIVSLSQATGSIRNDDGVPPVLPIGATGSNFGDPHIVTLDGLAYDFQAVGEFTLIEAVTGDPLNVQVRFEPVAGSQVASQTTAVATELGSARVMIEAGDNTRVTVNGTAFDLTSAIGGTALGTGEIYFDGEAITLVYANGEQLRIDVFDGFLSTSVSVGAGRDLRGLLGNADGDSGNDLALRDGTVLPQPVAFDTLYGTFADAWRISDTTTLFDYAPGQGTADFTDPDFPAASVGLEDFPVEVVAAAQAAAAGIEDPALRDAAILDYLVSGNTDYIEAAAMIDETVVEPVVETAPADAPALATGLGVSVSRAELTEGDSGSQDVVFTLYRTGDLAADQSLGYSFGGTADSADTDGATDGTILFGSGQASQELVVRILGDSTVETNETLTLSLDTTDSGDAVLIAGSAQVTIVNDDIAPPPEPEPNRVEGTGNSDNLTGTDGDDLILGLGGRYDRLTGLAGADTFVFGDETRNGSRERDVIRDYEVGIDSLLLIGGAEIATIRDTRSGATIFFEGDRDAVYLRGQDIDADNITIITDTISVA